jgi:CRISPR system Cascade subunit CasD
MNGFILHLQGPMMSYADTGFGQLREQGTAPSRSAVIGIIAAGMGIQRGDSTLLALHQGLRIHTACALPGAVLTDYHTVLTAGYEDYDETQLRREGAKGNPTLTWRSYHLDAHFVALVESSDEALIAKCHAALMDPVFVGYLGRRSCVPTIPLRPEPAEGKSIEEALHNAVRAAHNRRKKSLGKLPENLAGFDAYLDTAEDVSSSQLRLVARGWRRDLLVATPRFYVNRPVGHYRGYLPMETEQPNQSEPQTPSSSTSNERFFHDAP